MAEVTVKGATMAGDRVERLRIGLDRLPDRTIDRETAIRWLKDGHSFVPVIDGRRAPALKLVEVGDALAIRCDTAAIDADLLPDLPST
jgi:hypothetical protein